MVKKKTIEFKAVQFCGIDVFLRNLKTATDDLTSGMENSIRILKVQMKDEKKAIRRLNTILVPDRAAVAEGEQRLNEAGEAAVKEWLAEFILYADKILDKSENLRDTKWNWTLLSKNLQQKKVKLVNVKIQAIENSHLDLDFLTHLKSWTDIATAEILQQGVKLRDAEEPGAVLTTGFAESAACHKSVLNYTKNVDRAANTLKAQSQVYDCVANKSKQG